MKQWDKDSTFWLLTVEEFKQLPNGVELESANGVKAVKGRDLVAHDQRAKYIAWGIRDPFNHELSDLFKTFDINSK